MKVFIKGEYIDLEKFHHFYYNETSEEMIFVTTGHAGHAGHNWAKIVIKIKMKKEEYDILRRSISDFFQIPNLME